MNQEGQKHPGGTRNLLQCSYRREPILSRRLTRSPQEPKQHHKFPLIPFVLSHLPRGPGAPGCEAKHPNLNHPEVKSAWGRINCTASSPPSHKAREKETLRHLQGRGKM